MTKFATRLAEVRKAKGLNQTQLANMLNVKQTTVSGWEIGRHEPNYDLLRQIIIILECDANYLLGVVDFIS